MITLRVDAARIMVLQPVGADHDIAENQREIFAPLLGHGARQVAVAMRPSGDPGTLISTISRVSAIAKTASLNPSKRLSPRSAPCVSASVRWLDPLRSI